MNLTQEFVQQAYQHYNKTIFGNSLPEVSIRLTKSRRKRGWVTASYIGNAVLPKLPKFLGLQVDPADLRIGELVISTFYETTEKNFEEILVHEMVHVELFARGIYKTSGGDISHGKEFENRAQEIGIRHGIRISKTDASGDLVAKHNCKPRELLLSKRKSGGFTVALFKSGFVESNRDMFERLHKRYEAIYHGISSDPRIQMFPVCRAKDARGIKCYMIDQETAQDLLGSGSLIQLSPQV